MTSRYNYDITALTTTLLETTQDSSSKEISKVTELSGPKRKSTFPSTGWVRIPMFTAGNKVWYPHRGCRNLVLPYRIYNDSIKLDSKSFGIPGHFTRDVPETGTNTDELFIEEAKFVDIGTNVDTGTSEYLFIGTIGTNVDHHIQRNASHQAACGDIYIDSQTDNRANTRNGKEAEVLTSLNDADPKMVASNSNEMVARGLTKSVIITPTEMLASTQAEMVSSTLDKTVFNTEAVPSISTSDMVHNPDTHVNKTESDADISDTDTTISISIDTFHFFDKQSESYDEANVNEDISAATYNATSNDGVTNGSGDTEVNINKTSNSCTYLAFWNSNNCNNVSESGMNDYLKKNLSNIGESPVTRPNTKSATFFQTTVTDHWLYDNQGEYIIVRGGHGYGHVVKNPNWSPGHSRKSEWWPQFISWSCRVCTVGMLVLLGYCVYGKYRDNSLYE